MPQLDEALAEKLARLGAWARMNSIEAEMRELRAAFPELQPGVKVNGQPPTVDVSDAIGDLVAATKPTRKSTLSAAGRRAIVKAQKARWKKSRAERAARA